MKYFVKFINYVCLKNIRDFSFSFAWIFYIYFKTRKYKSI